MSFYSENQYRVRWPSPQRHESYLVEVHQLLTIHLLGLVKRGELDVLRGERLVGERSLDSVEIVGADGHEMSLTRQVLVELILQGNEGFIARLVELDVAEDGTGHQRTDLHGLFHIISA